MLEPSPSGGAEATSSTEERKAEPETSFSDLPDLVLGVIFKYLYWKEKLLAVEAFPGWARILESSLGWDRFENDRSYAHCHEPLVSSHYVLEEVACIVQYGVYFSHCLIWIQNFLPTDNPGETDFALLGAVETHCPHLKSLTVYHPPNLSSSSICMSFNQYIQPLQNILNSENSVQLGLCRLLYSSVEANTGAVDLLHFYRVHNLLQKVTLLDFSHGLILASTVSPLYILGECRALAVLKCPVQNLTTQLIQQLLDFSLRELYLVNDEHTLNLHYLEKDHISWVSLRIKPRRQFQVHYIFRNRSVCPGHMCLNPYARTLVFDSLCSSVSRALLRCVADLYGDSLQCLAFTLSVWEPLVPFSDLEDLPSNFQYMASRLRKLRSALLNLVIPSDALLTLASHAPRLVNLLVYEHKIFFGGKTAVAPDEVAELQYKISTVLGRPWSPIKQDGNLYQLTDSRQTMLFEENVSLWEGFW